MYVALSFVKVNSMICMVKFGKEINGPIWLIVGPYMYRMSGCSFARRCILGCGMCIEGTKVG